MRSVSTLFCLAIPIASAALAQIPPIHRTTLFPTGPSPIGIAVGDLDTDGVTDFIVPDSAERTFVVYHGEGPARFQTTFRGDYPAVPRMVELADVSGDGRLDHVFVTATSAGGPPPVLGIAVGTGVATAPFGAPTLLALDLDPKLQVLHDVDHDGDLDVVVAGPRGSSGAIEFLPNVSGSFSSAILVAAILPKDIAVGDIDGDGDADVVASQDKTLQILKNQGSGFVASAPILANSTQGNVLLADFTSDGILDLASSFDVVTGLSVPVTLRRGHGDGSFDPLVSVSNLLTEVTELRAFDRDADQDIDLEIWSDTGLLEVVQESPGRFRVEHEAMSSWFIDSRAARIDANLDGNIDRIYVDDEHHGVTLVLSQGSELFTHLTLAPSPGVWKAAGFADCDQDGRRDALAWVGNTLVCHRGIGNSSLAAVAGTVAPSTTSGVPQDEFDSVVVDLNLDGDPDFVAVDGFLLRKWFGASGTKMSPLVNQSNLSLLGSGPAIVAADFDHDGDADLVVSKRLQSAGVAYALRNSGTGVFSLAGGIATTKPARDVASGDFDQDGNLDIALACDDGSNGQVVVYRGNGALGFAAPQVIATARATHITAIDWDGDLDLDLVAGRSAFVLRNDGVGGFTSGPALPSPTDPSAELRLVRDCDADGTIDLLYRGDFDPLTERHLSTRILRHVAERWIEDVVPSPFTAGAFADDLDQDGRIDLVNSFDSYGVAVIGNGQVSVEHPLLAQPPCGGAIGHYGSSCQTKLGGPLPYLLANGCPGSGGSILLELVHGFGQSNTLFLMLGTAPGAVPLGNGCTLWLSGLLPAMSSGPLGSDGYYAWIGDFTPSLAGMNLCAQVFVHSSSGGLAATNGIQITLP